MLASSVILVRVLVKLLHVYLIQCIRVYLYYIMVFYIKKKQVCNLDVFHLRHLRNLNTDPTGYNSYRHKNSYI